MATCRKCGEELTDDNWYPSLQRVCNCICKECMKERVRMWRSANPDNTKLQWTRSHRKKGQLPMSENNECAAYLGVYIAEDLLRRVYENVEVMPRNNTGFDFICGRGFMVDIKSSCLTKNGYWMFTIRRNKIADYFLCIAFDNREGLNPLHVWLIPGDVINHLSGMSIRPSTVHKLDKYKIDNFENVVACCDAIKGCSDETDKNK